MRPNSSMYTKDFSETRSQQVQGRLAIQCATFFPRWLPPMLAPVCSDWRTTWLSPCCQLTTVFKGAKPISRPFLANTPPISYEMGGVGQDGHKSGKKSQSDWRCRFLPLPDFLLGAERCGHCGSGRSEARRGVAQLRGVWRLTPRPA